MRHSLLKHACVDAGQYGLNVSAADYVDRGVRLLRTTDLSTGIVREGGIFLGAPIESRFLIQAGDVLLSRAGTIGHAYLATASQAGSAFAGYLVRFRPRASADPRFIYYTTQTQPFQDQVATEAVVSTIANFNADRYANVRIPLPEKEEQRRIADFLDDQVTRIDNIIAARQAQAALLRDWATGRLHAAVFGTDSGRAPLTALAEVRLGRQRSPKSESGSHMTRYLRSANVSDGSVDLSDVKQMNFEPEERRTFALRPGDLLVTEGAGSPDAVGASAVWDNREHGLCFQNTLLRVRPRNDDVHSEYLGWWARASHRSGTMGAWATGASILHIGADGLKRVPIPLRPPHEQRGVIGDCTRIHLEESSLGSLITQAVAALQKLKRSLITAAVTGEFDVSSADGSRVPA